MVKNPVNTDVFNAVKSSNKKYLLFIVIFGLFALFFVLGQRSLENKDSVRFAEISREILEFDDWILLRLAGGIYPDKPPLHFWATAGLYKIFGISPFTARIPEALAGFCGILMAYFFGRKIFGNTHTAFLSAIILLSSYGYFFWARRTRIDIQMAVLFGMSLVFFYYGLEAAARKRKILWYATFWLASGLAIMSKGPVALTNLAVIIPYCILIFFKGEGRKIAPGLLALTSPVLLLPILPWVMQLVNHPRFSDYLQVYNQTVIMHRGKPFFTYFYDFPVKLFPASPFFFLGVWGFFRFRQQLKDNSGLIFALLWVGVFVFILHFTSGKTARYLLPVYLPSSLVAAWAIMFFIDKYPETFGKIMDWGDRIFLGIAVLSLLIPFFFAYYEGVSLLAPVPYVISLGLVIVFVRKWLPLKAAGLFCSFIILLLSIETGDGIINDRTSDYLRLSGALKIQELLPEEIKFYQCSLDSRARAAVSYYYNKVIDCSDSFKELVEDPMTKGIVTTRQALEKEIQLAQIEKGYRVIPSDRRFFIIIKAD
jgi:4-amino-4-deoxy-L-arabinose transferase-like glycosyltransferase